MPQTTGGGSSISKKAAKRIGRKAAVTGERTGRVTADRSKALVTRGTASKAMSAGYRKGVRQRAARSYLAKSSGTTRGEVRGVLKAVRSGELSKGGAIKALKGGPMRGVPAGNKRKVARAIRRAK